MTREEKIKMEDYVRHLFNIKREQLSQHLKEYGRDSYYNTEVSDLMVMRDRFGSTCIYPF